MESGFFNWFKTENIEVMEGSSHQKPAIVKGKSIIDILPKVLKTATLATLLSSQSPANAQDNVKNNDNTPIKTEQQTQTSQKDDKKTINFFNVADVKAVKEDGETYYIIDDKVVITPEMLKPKEMDKAYKKGEKELRSNAEEDRILQDTVTLSKASYLGVYSRDNKSINIPYIKNDLAERLKENPNDINTLNAKGVSIEESYNRINEHNDPNSVAHKSVKAHEEQHRLNDKLNIYAPGLSPEQYAIINQYDEVSANVAALNVPVNAYLEQIKKGVKKEDALKVFDNNKEFAFYKEAILNGLDPQSKEGKAKMVSGCMDLWKNEFSITEQYKEQLYNTSSELINQNSFQHLILGDEKEMQKRINKIFDNILVDGKTINMSQYLPKETLGLNEEIKQNLSYRVRDKTALDAEDIAKIKQNVNGKNDKQKEINLIKALSGIYKPEKSTTQEKNKSNTNITEKKFQFDKNNESR